MKRTTRTVTKTILALTTAALTLGALPQQPHASADAAIHTDEIRVALFIDSNKYKLVEPVVTLSSASGLDIGVRNAGTDAARIWATVGTSARVSLDQFSVMMLETVDFAAARALYGKLASMSGDSYILSRPKLGGNVYQVFYGSYPTKEAAESAKAQALKDTTVAAQTKAAAPVLTGPLHWTTGAFSSEAAAAAQAGVYQQAGLTADVALQEDTNGRLTYTVWVGSEATADQLNAVKQTALKAAAGVSLVEANTQLPYLLKRSDVTLSANGADAIPHFAGGAANQKTWIHPKAASISVKERADRSYRGDMEMSAYHDKLALINELPIEQYLYSVLGSELSSGWPAEALKAQAVAARTYALKQGNKYEIAQVSDTTLDQAYYGMQREFAGGIQAVDATKGEVLTYNNALIEPVFGSNAGGMTADPSEVWGNPVAYLRSVSSPDQGAEKGKAVWNRVMLADGRTGYVSAVYLKDTGAKDKEGAAYFEATEANVNVRLAPYVDNSANPAIGQLAAKERVLVLGQETESNAYSWIRGPYSAADIKNKLAAAGVSVSGDLKSLEISKRGPSGRVMELKANGVVVKVPYPDALRSALGGLPSTRFEIEVAGSYTGTGNSVGNDSSATASATDGLVIAGAGQTTGGSQTAESIYVLSGGQSQPATLKPSDLIALGASGKAQPMETSPTAPTTPGTSMPASTGPIQGESFIFRGTGNGHGLGMSQWGAKGYAELGYTYQKILQTYYAGVNITKE